MSTYLKEIADHTIPTSQEKYYHSKKIFDTDDIINAVKQAHDIALPQTKALSLALPGNTVMSYCRNLFNLLYKNVMYRPDIIGTQYVQLPSEVWNSKVCDCKSFSLFIATTLQNKGIPFKYRFVSYHPGSTKVTHVYIVVPNGSNEIIMDVVYKKFNQEKKPFYLKKEMKKNKIGLHIVGKIPSNAGVSKQQVNAFIQEEKKKQPFNFGGRDVTQMSEREFDLWLARDRTVLLKDAVAGITGPNSLKVEQFNDRIDVLDDALDSVQAADDGKINEDQLEYELVNIANDAINGHYSIAHEITGDSVNGFFKRLKKKIRKAAKKVKSRVKKAVKKRRSLIKKVKKKVSKTKVGRFIVKAIDKRNAALKKAGKAIAKVVTWPQRKIMEKIFKKKLPKSAPHFLYLFIPDNQVKKFPDKVQKKRKKAGRIKKFIVKATTMSDKQFMGIVRNGIIKKYKKEPEKVIDDMAKGMNVSFVAGIQNIGYIGAYELINEVGKLFRFRKPRLKFPRRMRKPRISPDDSPHPNDLENVRRVRVRRAFGKPNRRRGLSLTKGVKSGSFGSRVFNLVRTRRSIRRSSKPMYTAAHKAKLNKLRPKIRKSAPNFSYLFIKKESLKNLPQKVRLKRKKQERLADEITHNARMSKADFMNEVRYGIKERYGRTPENVVRGFINGEISGDEIGIIESILDLINTVLGLFKKKSKNSPKVSKDDVPDVSDFGHLIDDIKDKKQQLSDLVNSDIPKSDKRKLARDLKKEIKQKEKILKKSKEKISIQDLIKKTRKTAEETTPKADDFKDIDKDTAEKLIEDVEKTEQKVKKQKAPEKQTTKTRDIDMIVPDDEYTDYDRGGSNFWSSLS